MKTLEESAAECVEMMNKVDVAYSEFVNKVLEGRGMEKMTKREAAEIMVKRGTCNNDDDYICCAKCPFSKECKAINSKSVYEVAKLIGAQYLKDNPEPGWQEFILTGDEWEWEEDSIPNGRLIRYRKRQEKKPSHEEIMTLWWKRPNRACWFKFEYYSEISGYVMRTRDGSTHDYRKEDIAKFESATIPPEAK